MTNTNQIATKRAWSVAVVAALIIGIYFLREFLSAIALAAMVAYLFNPVYLRLYRKFGKRRGVAAGLTTIISFLALAIPVLLIIALAVSQTATLIDNIASSKIFSGGAGITQFSDDLANLINGTSQRIIGDNREFVNSSQIVSFVQGKLPEIIRTSVNILTIVVGSFPKMLLLFFVYLYGFVSFLVHQKKILETIHYLSPFDGETNTLYLRRMGMMTTAMVRGQFVIAVLQGLVSALAMLLLGLGDYFFFFWIFFTFLSFIPLGAGIVTIPIGLIAMAFGDVWQGALIILNHIIVVSSIDNIRPKLVPKAVQLPAVFTLLGALAGVRYFGFLGVIYGPIIMIVLVTTINTYVARRKEDST